MRSDSLEEEIATKSDMLRQLAREQAEGQQWRSRYEDEGLVSEDELDDLRRKQLAQIAELQNEVNAVASRLQTLEKQKGRLTADADSARADAESLAGTVGFLVFCPKIFFYVVQISF
jgi:chromosome segregation ATPase